jgi:transcriptional regulator with XRE-family HTH domain
MSYEVMKELGKKVYVARHLRRMSQYELGEKITASPTTISNIENGKLRSLHLDHLLGLVRVLKVSPNELLGWEEERSISQE